MFVLVKITDDLLFSGSTDMINYFFTRIRQSFKVNMAIIDGQMHFNGGRIEQDEHGTIQMEIKMYLDCI